MPAAAELRIDLAAEEANVEVLLFAFLFGISCYYYYVIKIIIRNYFCAIFNFNRHPVCSSLRSITLLQPLSFVAACWWLSDWFAFPVTLAHVLCDFLSTDLLCWTSLWFAGGGGGGGGAGPLTTVPLVNWPVGTMLMFFAVCCSWSVAICAPPVSRKEEKYFQDLHIISTILP